MLKELLKEKEKLILEKHEPIKNNLLPDEALQYLISQAIIDAMLIKDYKTFDSLITNHKDKINTLLTINFYNLEEGDEGEVHDSNDYSSNCNLLEVALNSNDKHFMKNIVQLTDMDKIKNESIIYYLLRDNDKNNFLKIVSNLENEEDIKKLIVSIMQSSIKNPYYNINDKENLILNPFIEWLIKFDFTPNIIKEHTDYILEKCNIYKLNNKSFFLLLPYLDKKILQKYAKNIESVEEINTYNFNPTFNELIKKLVKFDIINNSDDLEVMNKIKNKFSDFKRKTNFQITQEEIDKDWLETSLKSDKKTNKLNKI